MTLISKPATSTEQNKAIARRYVDEVSNMGNLAAIDELIAADYLHHSYGGISMEPRGPAFVSDDVAALSAIFAKAHWTIEDLIAEGIGLSIAGQPRVFTKASIVESQQREKLSPSLALRSCALKMARSPNAGAVRISWGSCVNLRCNNDAL